MLALCTDFAAQLLCTPKPHTIPFPIKCRRVRVSFDDFQYLLARGIELVFSNVEFR
jgi:hypothetical protein